MHPLEGFFELETEFFFHPDRGWRLDFAFPAYRVAVEIDGRGCGKPDAIGRHQTVDGIRRDLEKHRAAVLRGWHILRYPATDRCDAADWVKETRELLSLIEPVIDVCAACGCTEDNCSGCVARTGEPCYWYRPALCSACAARQAGAPGSARARRGRG